MTVTDSRGKTKDDADKTIAGTYGHYLPAGGVKDHYRFYAKETPDTAGDPNAVQMVLPAGGPDSGLYRYPKIGEQVLVACPGSGGGTPGNTIYYMLGYIPSKDNEFYNPNTDKYNDTGDRLFDQEGVVFRYKNTAQAFGGGAPEGEAPAHSEIGFYKKENAEWPVIKKDDKGKTVETTYPSIDTINIESAGDIREFAPNHYLQNAKRMEILVNAPEIDHKTNTDAQGHLPTGDYPGDDSALHAGDLHVRTGRRIVMKAEESIELQVGRTTLMISDDGFSVITRNVCGNMPNSFDAKLDMTPRGGVAINGKSIKLTAGTEIGLQDNWGGALKSEMGNLAISGRNISLDTLNSVQFMFRAIVQSIETLSNTITAGAAIDDSENVNTISTVKAALDGINSLMGLVEIAAEFWTGLEPAQQVEYKQKFSDAKTNIVNMASNAKKTIVSKLP
jgi:hypothetical protein